MIALAALALSLAPADIRGAELEVIEGRAVVVAEEHLHQQLVRDGLQRYYGPVHLEVPAASSAELRWRGVGSLVIEGPTILEWGDVGGQPLAWRASSVGTLEIELRERGAELSVPGSWVIAFGAGAWRVEGLHGGGTRLLQRAGDYATARWVGSRGYAPPPRRLSAGSELLLRGAPDVPRRPDHSAQALEWSASAWPWGRATMPGAPDLARGLGWSRASWPFDGPGRAERAPAWESAPWPFEQERAPSAPPLLRPVGPPDSPPADALPPSHVPSLPEPAPEVVPDPPPGPLQPDAPGPALAPREPAEEAPPVAVEPLREDVPAPRAAVPDPWRGVAPETLLRRGPLALEPGEGLAVEARADGGWRVRLADDAPRALWLFAPRVDARLRPGADLRFDPRGGLTRPSPHAALVAALPGR